jgi:hypothetical protein
MTTNVPLFLVKRLRRDIEDARNVGGMRVGLPTVTVDAANLSHLLDHLERCASERDAAITQLAERSSAAATGESVSAPTPAMVEAAARGMFEHDEGPHGFEWGAVSELTRSHYRSLARAALTATAARADHEPRGVER